MQVPSGSLSTTWLSQILSNSVRGFASDMACLPALVRAISWRLRFRSWLPARRRTAPACCARARRCGRDLPRAAAQIIQLGAAHVAAAHHGDLGDQRRVEREHALHALAVADLAHGEVAVQPLVGARDAHALEGLGAGALALDHLHRDAHRVAWHEVGHAAARGQAGDLLGLVMLDDVHRSDPSVEMSLRRVSPDWQPARGECLPCAPPTGRGGVRG